ncbi:hypothetical protein AB0I28_04415 [Phytomonospora sp. NPDC050363]|uniref:hypothetical protein n=1 Tax=Phytomonospora sp. NPDC050363 TaxID=3155642 RepID=UPI00340E461F
MSDTPIFRDETASVYAAAAPGGGPAVMVVGSAPVAASRFDPWAAALLSVSPLPGVATVFQAAREPDGRPMIVVDASGVTLAERLVAQGPLPVAEVHTAGVALAATLAQVHGTGLWHGAVCPSTVVFADTVRLAGFDACAPGMAKAPEPSRFTAPEGMQGPAGDVYALAATLYLALGGQLGGYVGDIYDVPPPLTAALRAALSPDVAQRPTAQQLFHTLSSVGATENTQPAVPMDPALVGAPVRPVNQTVVSINLAISGAAVTGMAAAAGVIVGHNASGALSALAGGTGAKAAAAKGFMGLSALKIGAFATGAAVIAAGAIVAVNVLDDEAAGPGPLVTAIQQFDFANTTFFDTERGFDAQLTGGKSPDFNYNDPDHGYRLADDPIVYADADGDNDLDAMTVLILENGNGYWRAAYVWLWEGDKAVQLPYALADGARCDDDFDPPTAVENGFRIVRKITESTISCAEVIHTDDPVVIGVKHGFPVAIEPTYGAAQSCLPSEYEDVREIFNYEPLIAPAEGAPTVDTPDRFKRLELVYTTWQEDEPPEWLRVRMTRNDDTVSCGWVPNNGLDD